MDAVCRCSPSHFTRIRSKRQELLFNSAFVPESKRKGIKRALSSFIRQNWFDLSLLAQPRLQRRRQKAIDLVTHAASSAIQCLISLAFMTQ